MGGKERRVAANDRRQRDYGPPSGCIERRKQAERRLPAAVVAQISAEDFEKFFGSVGKAASSDHQIERAAENFGRVRDGY